MHDPPDLPDPPDASDLPGLDLAALGAHLRRELPGGPAGALRAELVAGGRSNLTYRVTDGASRWVLRRPPLGHVLATAHDMAREARVVTALAGSAVPVPQVVLACAHPAVLGAPFYLMAEVDGVVLRDAATLDRHLPDAATARRCVERLVDVLADLHAVDPAAVGLADLGRPEGFLSRQVSRWARQLEASRSRDLAGVDVLVETLAATVPAAQRVSVLHGDYRLDNVLVDPADPSRVTAVLDWEMATVGDPLADLGLLLAYYGEVGAVTATDLKRRGGPSHEELVARYADRTGLDVGGIDWYLVLALFKVAVVLEGIHYRHGAGLTVGEGFGTIGALVPPLLARAGELARGLG